MVVKGIAISGVWDGRSVDCADGGVVVIEVFGVDVMKKCGIKYVGSPPERLQSRSKLCASSFLQ